MRKPYSASTFGGPMKSPLASTGMIMALDKDTGRILWTFNVGSEIGIGGASIGNGMVEWERVLLRDGV